MVDTKKQHIKGKLQDKFPSAEKCFNALDEDGGGSLDRCKMLCCQQSPAARARVHTLADAVRTLQS